MQKNIMFCIYLKSLKWLHNACKKLSLCLQYWFTVQKYKINVVGLFMNLVIECCLFFDWFNTGTNNTVETLIAGCHVDKWSFKKKTLANKIISWGSKPLQRELV